MSDEILVIALPAETMRLLDRIAVHMGLTPQLVAEQLIEAGAPVKARDIPELPGRVVFVDSGNSRP